MSRAVELPGAFQGHCSTFWFFAGNEWAAWLTECGPCEL